MKKNTKYIFKIVLSRDGISSDMKIQELDQNLGFPKTFILAGQCININNYTYVVTCKYIRIYLNASKLFQEYLNTLIISHYIYIYCIC